MLRNPLRRSRRHAGPPGAGLGLIGLTERAELRGGRLEHRRRDGSTFVLHGWIPWAGVTDPRRSACWSSTTTRWCGRR